MIMFFELFYSEKSSHARLEHTTFWSPVRRSNHWAIRMAKRSDSILDISTAKR